MKEWLQKNDTNKRVLDLMWPLIFVDKCQLTYESSMYENMIHNMTYPSNAL
jgi:hypothetical protein